MNRSVSKWTEEEERNYVIELLTRRDMLTQKDNVIYCPKAFIINAVLKMLFKKSRKKRQTKEDWLRYLKIIDSYIKDKTDIRWNNGKVEVYEK